MQLVNRGGSRAPGRSAPRDQGRTSLARACVDLDPLPTHPRRARPTSSGNLSARSVSMLLHDERLTGRLDGENAGVDGVVLITNTPQRRGSEFLANYTANS